VHAVNEAAMHFPYKVSPLKPYTFYNVTILHKYQKLFSQEIRTHEGGELNYCILRIHTLRSLYMNKFYLCIANIFHKYQQYQLQC
jgi:hypothetical protein